MKNNKVGGFTLIELLAVIVILAIIALIVTPIVSNIISAAKNSANARSVEGHIDNIEYGIIQKAFNDGTEITQYDATYDKNSTNDDLKDLPAAVKSNIPSNDTITCDKYVILNGLVSSATNCTKTGWAKSYNYTSTDGARATD